MSIRESQKEIVLQALNHFDLSKKQIKQISYNELKKKLEDYVIPYASCVELKTDFSCFNSVMQTIVHAKSISKDRFNAMMKQISSLDEI